MSEKTDTMNPADRIKKAASDARKVLTGFGTAGFNTGLRSPSKKMGRKPVKRRKGRQSRGSQRKRK